MSDTAPSDTPQPDPELREAAGGPQDDVTGALLEDPVEPVAEQSSRTTWAAVTLASACGLVLVVALALALTAGWRLPEPAPAHAASVATDTAPAGPSIGTLMSAADPTVTTDRLGAFAAETPTTSSGEQGPAGLDGTDGIDGAEGPVGAQGATGATGSVGATGPAGFGLTMSEVPTASVSIVSPDGVSYRIVVTDDGIYLQGPTSTQVWSDTSHFQIPTP